MHIIDSPSLKTKKRRLAEGLFMAVGTLFTAYFLILFTIAAWFAGGMFIYDYALAAEDRPGTVLIAAQLTAGAVFTLAVMLGWAEYNMRVFGRRNRRKDRGPTTLAEIAAYHNVGPETIEAARVAKLVRLQVAGDGIKLSDFDEGHRPAAVEHTFL